MTGTLHLLPTWLGDDGGIEQLAPEAVDTAARLDLLFCEDERTARRMLRRMHPSIDLQRLELHRFDKDSDAVLARRLIQLVRDGRDAGVISEAGMPCIADPGALLVAAAHDAGVRVVPYAGPSALLLALAGSGLDGQRFTFHGYLPVKPPERAAAIRRLEQEARRSRASQLFIETPYRNDALLADLLRLCAPDTQLCIAIAIAQGDGWIVTKAVREWSKAVPALGKRPAVFIIGTR